MGFSRDAVAALLRRNRHDRYMGPKCLNFQLQYRIFGSAPGYTRIGIRT
jgi:hypothetical protein